ncbi:MAG: sulfurtransferase [Firmicutes bacterium HGW-Firmicutes-1]|jgi:rhodanese-related sulfurtransferase|nr:MAG: sulfurtransferase [Firmicutes bacterium HGW-Firmicutes-1]
MKNMKNLLVFILVSALVLSLMGCAKEEVVDTSMDIASETPEAPEEAVVETKVVEEGVLAYFANMPENGYKIKEAEFVEKVKAGDEMVILDIRTAEDYAKGHVAGAINVPWGTEISSNITKIPQDKEVFIYCYTGQTAGQAVMTLNLAGINARSVEFGWNLGISKVEGFEAVTDVNEFGSDVYEVDPEIEAALNDYYGGLAAVQETKYKFYKISEDDLKAMMESDEDFYILSVRQAADFEKGHIEGASNIPFIAGMEQQFSTLPMDKKIVVYCYTGQTSGQVVAGLRLLGYDAVSLNAGMGKEKNAPAGWANKGYEVVQ